MINSTNLKRKALRGGAALQALALLGAGLAGTAVLSAPAAAQDYTNVTASGKVQGTNGQAVAGATVEIRSDEQGFTRTVTTDNSGGFRVPQIPAGTYTFTITASGFDTYSESGVPLNQQSAGNQFTLAAAGSAATGDVVVTAGRVRTADFEGTTTGQVINIGDLSTRVPVSRTLRDVILLAPGTIQGSSSQNAAFAGQAQISGSSFTENAYYVNGLNITEFRQGFSPVTVPFDFYETVDVKTGGFQAEFGRATGGVVNAVTKSGSNDFHGSILFNWEPDELRSNAPNTYLSDNDGDFSDRKDFVAQLSGPIIKDKLFFYGIYNARDLKTFDGSVAGTGTFQRTRSPFWGGKIDAVPFDGQRLEFTYFNSEGVTNSQTHLYNPTTNVIGAFTGSGSARFGGENYVGRYTGTFTPWLTVSAAYGKNKNRAGTLPADLVNARTLDTRTVASGVALPGTNPSTSFTTNDDEREFYRGDVDLYFKILGSHHVRFGYDREDLTSTQVQNPIGGGLLTISRVGNAASQTLIGQPIGTEFVTQRFFSVGGTFKSRNEAYYVQDNWALFDNRLTLQLGVRNDRFVVNNGLGQSFYKSGNQWGPRLGATFDVFGDGKAKLFGSFGRYFIPIFSNTNIRAAGVQFDRTAYYRFSGLDANGRPILGAPILTVNGARACPDTNVANCRVISSGSSKDPSFITSRNLKSQYLDEYIIGGEWRFAPRWRFGIEGTYRNLGRAIEDAAVDQAAIAYCRTQGFTAAQCNATYGGFDDYVLINPGSDQTITLFSDSAGVGLPNGTNPTVAFTAAQLGYPTARRKYYAVTAKFDREFDGKWSLSGSYTWSQLKGNYEGGAKSDIGQADTGITQDFDQPGFTIGAYGYLPGHRRHTFKLFGSYQPFEWLSVGANGLVQSPKKFGCIGVIPPSVDPFANQYGAAGFYCGGKVVPRGSAFESDWRKELNLTAQIKMPVDFDASIRFDVFNVFNTKSVLEFDEFGEDDNGNASPQYRLPLGFQTPRSARVQFRVGF